MHSLEARVAALEADTSARIPVDAVSGREQLCFYRSQRGVASAMPYARLPACPQLTKPDTKPRSRVDLSQGGRGVLDGEASAPYISVVTDTGPRPFINERRLFVTSARSKRRMAAEAVAAAAEDRGGEEEAAGAEEEEARSGAALAAAAL